MARRQLQPLPSYVRIPSDSEVAFALKLRKERYSTECKTCRGTRTFRMWTGAPFDETAIEEFDCPCDDQIILRWWLLVKGIPGRYLGIRWADAVGVPADARAVLDPWLAFLGEHVRRGSGLFLHGTTGSGKSMLAMLIAKVLLGKGLDVRVIDSMRISTTVDDWRNPEVREWWNGKIRGAEVLVIDDLGKSAGGTDSTGSRPEWLTDRVAELFHYRSGNLLSTIVSSNHTVERLAGLYGSYVSELIEESCTTIEIRGEVPWRIRAHELAERELALGINRPVVLG